MQLASKDGITAGKTPQTVSRWLTAGIAAASVGAIAVAPGVAPLPDPQLDVRASQVRLTAGWEPFAQWKAAFNTSSANASTLVNNFFLAPGVALQQAIVNQADYANQVLNDPSSINVVLEQFLGNVAKVASAMALLTASDETIDAVVPHTLDNLHGVLRTAIPDFIGPDNRAAVVQILNFLSSPASGLFIGAVGPFISPWVALTNSVIAVADAISAGDTEGALTALLDTPANIVNAFFNGATLDLSVLAPALNQSGVLGDTTINAISFAFGGLLSVGSVSQGTYKANANADPITVPGGSILNSLGLNITTDILGPPLTLDIPGQPVGPLGALLSIDQTIGVLLGSGWDGKNAFAVPPLSKLKFPIFNDIEDVEDEPSAEEAGALQSLAADEGAVDEGATSELAANDVPSTDNARLVTLTVDSSAASDEDAGDSDSDEDVISETPLDDTDATGVDDDELDDVDLGVDDGDEDGGLTDDDADDTDLDVETGTGPGSGTGPDSGTGSDSESGNGSDSDTGSGSGADA
ncbi:outer membrane porin GjpA [Mycolicibacterium pulveris]|uniref:PE-PGRS family protein n=1 Tax=Mycolicibacterium pulveris TaxID=36813 RepID=A0A7I7UEA4_MYCPV|nr:outer membrane porin GjpA [Mycolicibacterium pulveris]MCV6981819.1 outer membrane porin GjpA [Mycolicibacterium pulveris]BBY79181.1 hypothetical protein MPUL_03390 [Mycolicibacterium pulveris]